MKRLTVGLMVVMMFALVIWLVSQGAYGQVTAGPGGGTSGGGSATNAVGTLTFNSGVPLSNAVAVTFQNANSTTTGVSVVQSGQDVTYTLRHDTNVYAKVSDGVVKGVSDGTHVTSNAVLTVTGTGGITGTVSGNTLTIDGSGVSGVGGGSLTLNTNGIQAATGVTTINASNLSVIDIGGGIATLIGSSGDATNVYNILNYGGVADGVTDNTLALSNTIWAAIGGVKTNKSVGAEIVIPEGIWAFTNAPQNFESTENCVIAIPHKPNMTYSSDRDLWSYLRIRGARPNGYWAGTATAGVVPTNGTILLINNTNAGTFIKSLGTTNGSVVNCTTLELKDLTFATQNNSAMTFVDATIFTDLGVYDCSFVNNFNGSAPLAPGGRGIIMPRLNLGNYNKLVNVNFEGLWNALTVSEHFWGDMVNIANCKTAVLEREANFDIAFSKLYTGNCATNFGFDGSGGGKLNISGWEIERTATDWRSNVVDFAANNNVTGKVRWKLQDNNNASNNDKLHIIGAGAGIIFEAIDYPGAWTSLSTGNLGYRGIYGHRFSDDGIAPNDFLYKGRGTPSSPVVPDSGDILGVRGFGGYDGATYPGIPTAWMLAKTTGSSSSGSVPTAVDLYVGANSSAGIQMTWQPSGISTTNSLTVGQTLTVSGDFKPTKTITAGGTTGAQTINKNSGSVNFAASAQSLLVTDSLVTTSSVIICTVATDDTTAKSAIAVAGSGSFTIKLNATATAETRVSFLVTN